MSKVSVILGRSDIGRSISALAGVTAGFSRSMWRRGVEPGAGAVGSQRRAGAARGARRSWGELVAGGGVCASYRRWGKASEQNAGRAGLRRAGARRGGGRLGQACVVVGGGRWGQVGAVASARSSWGRRKQVRARGHCRDAEVERRLGAERSRARRGGRCGGVLDESRSVEVR
jgi:hypothetical protein